jgi:hypothetical protein
MNHIEARALNWIAANTGYKPSEIEFSNNDSPDFITPDGRGFEVKHYMPGDRCINIYPRQWPKLLQANKCVILIFGELSHPEAIIPMTELPIGIKRWGKFRIQSLETNLRSLPREKYLEILRIKNQAATKVAA